MIGRKRKVGWNPGVGWMELADPSALDSLLPPDLVRARHRRDAAAATMATQSAHLNRYRVEQASLQHLAATASTTIELGKTMSPRELAKDGLAALNESILATEAGLAEAQAEHEDAHTAVMNLQAASSPSPAQS